MCAKFRSNSTHTSVQLYCCEENYGGIFFTAMQWKSVWILHTRAFTCIALKKMPVFPSQQCKWTLTETIFLYCASDYELFYLRRKYTQVLMTHFAPVVLTMDILVTNTSSNQRSTITIAIVIFNYVDIST